jgi:hypothetical protein
MTKRKIAAFGAAGLAALLIGFVMFAYYNFTHNFNFAISDQQRSDIETALKGSLGEAIFSGQRAQVVAYSTIEGKRGLDALLAHPPSDIKGHGLIEAYQKDPQKFKRYAQMLDTATNAKQVGDAILRENGALAGRTSESLAIEANYKVDAWGKPFCIIPVGERVAVVSGGPSRLSCDALPLTPDQIAKSNRTMYAGPSDVVVVITAPSQHSVK